jgi:hypothetical protein
VAHKAHVAHLAHLAHMAVLARHAAAIAARRAAAHASHSSGTGAQARTLRSVTALSGSPRDIARQLLATAGQGGQFSCLNSLWEHESGWVVDASNPGSGAYGIPQALPGSKMSSAGPDWQSDAATQIRWGLSYINGTYGSPCGAWSHEESAGWY